MVNQRFHICDSMNEGREANKRTEEIQKTGTGNHDDTAPASERDEEDKQMRVVQSLHFIPGTLHLEGKSTYCRLLCSNIT